MQAALHQHARAAQGNGLLDLLIHGFERLDITFRRAHGTIEGAEGAVFGADVGVVDVAVDLISDHVAGMKALADGVRLHADAQQVIGAQHVESLFFGNAHAIQVRSPGSEVAVRTATDH